MKTRTISNGKLRLTARYPDSVSDQDADDSAAAWATAQGEGWSVVE